jgi:Rrf2 family iron-sulfur cluster assembly transcriptional regulator
MKLSTKGRYALMAMIDIAIYSKGNEHVSLYQISTRCNISMSYLEQLFIKLKKAKLVLSAKGPKGGYLLSRTTQEISVANVVDAVDEKLEFLRCNNTKDCLKTGKQCSTHHLWSNFMGSVYGYLSSISLQNILDDDFEVANQTMLKQG